MRAVLIAATMSVLPAVALGQSGQQFDLVCTGTQTTIDAGGSRAERQTQRYRIDLAARRWCQEDCKAALKIQEVTPDEITLVDGEMSKTLQGHHRLAISRTSAEVVDEVSMRALNLTMTFNGSCSKKPFSGHPKPKF